MGQREDGVVTCVEGRERVKLDVFLPLMPLPWARPAISPLISPSFVLVSFLSRGMCWAGENLGRGRREKKKRRGEKSVEERGAANPSSSPACMPSAAADLEGRAQGCRKPRCRKRERPGLFKQFAARPTNGAPTPFPWRAPPRGNQGTGLSADPILPCSANTDAEFGRGGLSAVVWWV